MKNYIFLFLFFTGVTTLSYAQLQHRIPGNIGTAGGTINMSPGFEGSFPQVQLRIPDTTGTVGPSISVPVYIDSNLTGQNVYSYQIQISFDATLLKVTNVIVTGTVSQSFGTPAFNANSSGVLTIAAAGTSPLSGKGIFLYIQFQLLQSGGSSIAFTDNVNNMLDEGSPSLILVNGSIYINPPPSITISPDSYLLTAGDSLQFYVSGDGTPPYHWSVTNSAIASIDANGILHAIARGFTQVIVKDFNGLIDTTNGQIEIRALKLTIPDTTAILGQTIDIPVYTTALNNLGINSGSLTLSYDQTLLTPVGVITTNTLLASYNTPTVNTNTPGQVTVAIAGTTSLTGSGVLLYVRFSVSSQNSGGTSFSLSNVIFNENILANTVNGSLYVPQPAVLSIYPNTASLIAGDSLQFDVSNGVAPYTWSTSNAAIATINSAGLLTAKKGGVITVTVTDSQGAHIAKGNIQIYDTYVSIPDTNVCSGMDTVDIFLKIGQLPAGESISSIQATITYQTSAITPIAVVSAETLTNGWSYIINTNNNQFVFAGAGGSGFNISGVMVKVRFLVSNLAVGGTAWVNISNITLNEGTPLPEVFNGSVTKNTCSATLGLKMFIQGYYAGNGMMTQVLYNEGIDPNPNSTNVDTVTVSLVDSVLLAHDPNDNSTDADTVATTKGILQTNGSLSVTFPGSTVGHKYYLMETHRNAVQTWSAYTFTIINGGLYDFTTGATKAYGANEVANGDGTYSFYSGDLNQNGGIDAFDFLILDPDIISGNGGYLITDINGSGGVDAFDFLVLDPNIINGVGSAHP